VRNSSLIKRSCAENVTGLSILPKIWALHWIRLMWSGRGALISHRSLTGRFGGALSSENAGMSNLKEGENPSHRKSKVSWAMIIIPGLVGPKPRRFSGGDGQRVNIPVPACTCLQMRGMIAGADSWLYPSNQSNGLGMKGFPRGADSGQSTDQKSLQAYGTSRPYRKPTQVLRSSRPRCTSDSSSRNSAN
jgi:hypothetical protein